MIGLILLFLFLLCLLIGYMSIHIYLVIRIKKYRKTITAGILLLILLLVLSSRMFMGFIVHFLVGLVISDILFLLLIKIKNIKMYHYTFIAFLIACLLTGYGYDNMHHIQYVKYDVTIQKNFEEKRILAISDLHLSTGIHYDDLKQIEEYTKKRNIDMIFILGDLFDESSDKEEVRKAIAFFDRISQTCPVYYVVGNHDGMQGRENIEDGILKEIDESHIIFLKDEVVYVQGIYIIGRLDQSYQRKKTAALMKKIDTGKPIVLLDHQPKQIKENASLGVDLQLSGHTHNGQVWPLGTVCNLFHINEVEYGYVKIDGMDVIVSSGMGSWGFPIKSQGKSEILEINLKHK